MNEQVIINAFMSRNNKSIFFNEFLPFHVLLHPLHLLRNLPPPHHLVALLLLLLTPLLLLLSQAQIPEGNPRDLSHFGSFNI